LTQLGSAALEYKLDGARIQVHKRDQEIRIFTRQLNDVTQSVPEVVEIVKKLPANNLILDGEALALRDDGKPQPFQVTMRRFGRKLAVERLRQDLPLTGFYIEIGRDEFTVYVRPELVVEIAFNEVQASAQYPGGLALRFARVKRYRPDKRADEADTIEAVRRIHQRH
jgi:ATP-dependent DNA ligase